MNDLFERYFSSGWWNAPIRTFKGKMQHAWEAGFRKSKELFSVDDRSPKEGSLVEVYNENCAPKYSHSIFENGEYKNPYVGGVTSPKPTHWRYVECPGSE